MSTASLPEPGELIDGKVEVIRLLGQGGMGAVYAAQHRGTGRPVAVKVLRSEIAGDVDACARFVQEALACGRIRHPNVIDVLDAASTGGRPYLVMELLEGETLAQRVARTGPLPVNEALDILEHVIAGVEAAHASGIVHRDLKPENVFLAHMPWGSTVVKVLDFGISKMVGVDSLAQTGLALTGVGTVLGTPYYMSPEQARGARDLDARTDVYALGAIAYYVLTGRPPFLADSYNGLLAQILLDDPAPITTLRPDVPPRVADLVARALTKKPDDRIASVAALRERVASLTRVVEHAVVLHTDLVDFGDVVLGESVDRAAEVLEHWDRTHQRAVARHGGTVRIVAGEEFIVTFASVEDALRAWLEIVSTEHPEHLRAALRARAGVARGELRLVRRAVFGESLYRAVRLTLRARTGEIAIDRALADTISPPLRAMIESGDAAAPADAPAISRMDTADAVVLRPSA